MCRIHDRKLLWAFEVPVNDLMLVQVAHPRGDLFRPLHQLLWGNLLPLPQQVEERPIGTIFHDDTEDGRLGTNATELNDVWVVELSQVLDVHLVLLLHFLHGHRLPFVLADKHGPLGAGTEPFQVGDVLKRDLPVICRNKIVKLCKLFLQGEVQQAGQHQR